MARKAKADLKGCNKPESAVGNDERNSNTEKNTSIKS